MKEGITCITVVGAGLFGATCAYLLKEKGYSVRVFEERPVVGGMAYDELRNGILVHKHGAHIFHTKSRAVWQFVNQFGEFNNYVHTAFSLVDGQYISFPPNRMTYQQLGTDEYPVIYNKLFAGYTAKQWGGQAPEWAIKRIPFRNTFDNVYFTGEYQGIPVKGYTALVRAMLAGIPIEHKRFTYSVAKHCELVIYTGAIDMLFSYRWGELQYRSLCLVEKEMTGDYQGCAVVNHPSASVPFTRTIEHKHFYYQECENTIVTYEYPCAFNGTNQRYYPVLSPENKELYQKYLHALPKNILVGGRLGTYRYLDMGEVVEQAFTLCNQL